MGREMHPIDKVHNKIAAGYVLNLYGEWVSRSTALKSKQQLLQQVFSGNVEINGQWVSLQSVRESWGQKEPDLQKVPIKERDVVKDKPIEKVLKEKPDIAIESVSAPPVQQKQRFSPLHNGVYDHGSVFLPKATLQLNSETVLSISETEIQFSKVNLFAIDGYVDQSNCKQIHEELTSRINSDIRFYIFDFSRATLITSAGWGLLAALKGQLNKIQGDLMVSAMSKEIEESFRMLQFETILKRCSSNEECLQSIKTIVQKSMIESATSYVQGDRLISSEGAILPHDMPLQEKIKAVIAQFGPVTIGEIGRILKDKEFGKEKVGFFKLYFVLREMNLETEVKRKRYYRSC